MSTFEFSPDNRALCEDLVKRYPQRKAAMLPVLHIAQDQHGFISPEVESHVAEFLEVPPVEVHQVVTFYTLYHREKPGRHVLRLCMSPSCWLRGAEGIKEHLEQTIGVPSGGTTDDGRMTWEAVSDCLGACEIAPMMQLDKDYYGDLTPERVDELLSGAD